MVLKIFYNNEVKLFTDIDSTFCVTKSYGGMLSLQFDISPKHSIYKYLTLDGEVEYENQRYLIKSINERKTVSTIVCELNLDDLRADMFTNFNKTTESFHNVCTEILSNTDWTVKNDTSVSKRCSFELTDVTVLDILNQCTNSTSYGNVYEFNTKKKQITLIKPENITKQKGVYFTDELNLTDLNFKGSSSNLVTRLYAYGKDGLSISSVNNNCDYIENHSYTDKIISYVWRDERYTNAQALYDDAVVKLANMAQPEQSYTCKVIDLAKAQPDIYKDILSYSLYDVVTLIDRNRKKKQNYRIVEIKEYPAKPILNTVTLSSIPAKITGKLTTINNRITELNAQQLHDRTKVNEIKQDLDTTVLHVSESWASSVNESLFTQTAEGLFLEVNKVVGTNRWSTLLQQSAEDVRIAWNNISEYIKFENAQLNIYNTSDKKLMSINQYGQDFYYHDNEVGSVGTSSYLHDDNKRGLSFDLNSNSAYMTWAYRCRVIYDEAHIYRSETL
jgi:phage minor structural protein|nr:MAG TPA: tail protein [Caudoviricetes sp.]